MGIRDVGSSPFLLCEEDSESVFGRDDGLETPPELLGMDHDLLGSFGLQVGSDELVGSLMEKEMEQLTEDVRGDYLERLRNGGMELACRIHAIDWICKVQAHHNFGPLFSYLAVNYLDRFLSSKEFSNDAPWAQQLLTVACLSIAAKVEETTILHALELQVCNPAYMFEAKTIQRMEIIILSTLKWRMQAVTPFSYIDHFLDRMSEGKPLTYELLSRCSELIMGTMKAIEFLKFRPSEIATAVAMSVVAQGNPGFSSVVLTPIPVDKGNVGKCHQALQEMALVMQMQSPSGELDAYCFTFRSDGKFVNSSTSRFLVELLHHDKLQSVSGQDSRAHKVITSV
ncbi:hypothetical protein GUJ93_ZPchr0003g17512 [Zizania palustris]|uniref:Cyclin N-terminal domain-containing protein n=1 Tax=Zizania palustris TaxID=103762 RepID=A0A8J5SMA8_ZIZPA|nr:hypothetical protein GUJ93_ZPchr0003g17512 [Zizania palustris]